MANSPLAIEVQHLTKVYKTTRAVDGIDFALAPGSITGLLGGNGAGKTTTIAMIMGLVTPTAGSVRVLGADMPRQRYRVLHRMNFESPYVDMPMRLTVRQNLKVFGMIYAVPDLTERIKEIAAQFDLVDLLDRPAGKLSARRIGAMVLRYWYLLRSSWPRMLELIYWPAVQMFMWGFLQLYISSNAGFFARAGATFIGAVLLWDILFRGQLGFSVSFLEEMWARNMGNLMISPLRPVEFISALMIMSLIRLAIGMVPVSLLAIAFFGFNLYGLGLALAAFFVNLTLTSWSVGIVVSGLVLRNGMGAESLAWTFMFVLLPLTCVYYPESVLPAFMQPIAWALPPTYVFEGMRALLIDHTFRLDLMLEALALNVVLFTAMALAFVALLASARRNGSLMQTGE